METLAFQTNLDESLFEDFLRALSNHLGLPASAALHDGVRELESAVGDASVALDRSEGFVAARWSTVSRPAVLTHEAFFVRPDGMPAKAGYRVRRRHLPETQEHAEDLEPADWWLEVTKAGSEALTATVPSFLELVASLCARARVATANPALAARIDALEGEESYLRTMLDQQKQELRRYKSRLRALELESSGSTAADGQAGDEQERFESLDALPSWAVDNVSRIAVLPRALNGAKKSLYEKPEHICKALELLAGPYRDHRMGLLSIDEFARELAKTGLKLEGSVSPSVAGEQGEAYFVQWAGRRRFMDLHLLKGGGRDERYCLRVYFFWDAASQRVVCGALPFHLSNSLS